MVEASIEQTYLPLGKQLAANGMKAQYQMKKSSETKKNVKK